MDITEIDHLFVNSHTTCTVSNRYTFRIKKVYEPLWNDATVEVFGTAIIHPYEDMYTCEVECWEISSAVVHSAASLPLFCRFADQNKCTSSLLLYNCLWDYCCLMQGP